MNAASWTLIFAFASAALTPGAGGAEEAGGWIDLTRQVEPKKHAVAGDWRRTEAGLTTNAVRSSRLALPYQPPAEYDFRVSFTRVSGVHSIALIFAAGRGQGSFEVDAWSRHLAGLQSIGGKTIQDNPTRSEGLALTNGQAHTALVQVRRDRVRAYLDDKLLAEHRTDGSDLSLLSLWKMPDSRMLGLGAYDSATIFHRVEVRPLRAATPAAASIAATPPAATPPAATPPAATPPASTPPSAAPSPPSGPPPRVLIVIANQDFFYREYHDPREQLERAGIVVEVAAARRQPCHPHSNSGQRGSGAVLPDFALADVDPSRYDAIMFSGGWGASMYQYAFPGEYSNRGYNGDRQTKAVVNKLIGDFAARDKHIGALCHGVSVLAWSRVNGKSLLDGKRAVGSPRQSPAGVYQGQRGQPLSRWNAEVNGARLSAARSIGDPLTSADDVLVDGRIITGEDDNSSALFGATLARLLTRSPGSR